MADMARHGWKWLELTKWIEIAGYGWKLLKWLKPPENNVNDDDDDDNDDDDAVDDNDNDDDNKDLQESIGWPYDSCDCL